MEVPSAIRKIGGRVALGEFEEVKGKSTVTMVANSSRFCMRVPNSRSQADLKYSMDHKRVLGCKDVEVSVRATGLNSKDFMVITKPKGIFADTYTIGLEFSGIISDLGSEVSKFKIGDSVFGLAGGACGFASHIVVDENLLAQKPDSITHIEAAALPVAFCASIYSLGKLTNLTGSDTVLIHGATGSVGLSAIQICKILGAKIVATAGSKRKRAYLRCLGVNHVFDSRSTFYGEEIKETVGGVDVVLNSLAGRNFTETTLSVCNKNARFIELGIVDTWQQEYIHSIRPDLSYNILDFSEMTSEAISNMMCTVAKYITAGFYTPLPVLQMDGLQCRKAFEYSQKAQHIGKIVLTTPTNIQVPVRNTPLIGKSQRSVEWSS